MEFMDSFCEHCQHDNMVEGEHQRHCTIIPATMMLYIGDPEYPAEWIQDDDGSNPRCTKYKYHDWNQGPPDPNDQHIPDPPNQLKLTIEQKDELHNTVQEAKMIMQAYIYKVEKQPITETDLTELIAAAAVLAAASTTINNQPKQT
jgi:hypothetical protein